jgi:hypothetical protein
MTIRRPPKSASHSPEAGVTPIRTRLNVEGMMAGVAHVDAKLMEITETIGERNITEARAAERKSSQLLKKMVERRLHAKAVVTKPRMTQGNTGNENAPCEYECKALLAESQGRARLLMAISAPMPAKARRGRIMSFAISMFYRHYVYSTDNCLLITKRLISK